MFKENITVLEKKKFTIFSKKGAKIIKRVIYGFLLSDFNFGLKIQEENGRIHRIKNFENAIEEKI